MAAIRNTNYYEMGLVHPRLPGRPSSIYQDYWDGLEAIDAEGCVEVPEGPGLGVEIDWDFVTRRRTGGQVFDAS
jgi:L-alanine-DL-glutamate epimerase-like enolase superfamily enzyme